MRSSYEDIELQTNLATQAVLDAAQAIEDLTEAVGNPQASDPLLDQIADLTAPGATRILYFDFTLGTFAWLQIGANLSITTGILNASGGGGGSLSDGDKGDITVTASGATWTIDNGVVALAKLSAAVQTSLALADSALQSGAIGVTIQGYSAVLAATDASFTAAKDTKLSGIAASATANATDAQLRDRTTHTGTQDADTLTDGTTNKAFLATERIKLSGIATSATANSSDATLLARENHTGSQAQSTVTDLVTDLGNKQTLNANLTSIAALSTTAYGRGLLTLADAAALTASLDAFTSLLKGAVPASGGGTSNFLRADGSWAAPGGGGADPWTYAKITGSDFTTTSATAVDVTGLAFTPAANKQYVFEGYVMLRTATATINPRLGLAWPTGLTDGVATIEQVASATTKVMVNGNIGAALLVAVGGLPNNTQSWIGTIWGVINAGATPSGTVKVQLASETAGTVVRITIGSMFRYREI